MTEPVQKGKRTNINLTEKDLKNLEAIKKHLPQIGIEENDTAAIKRALYIYSKLITTGIRSDEEI